MEIKMSDSKKRSFTTWYEKHKEKFNSNRKSRYQNDPEYRELVKSRSRRYREENPGRNRLSEGAPFREINGKQVRVYKIGQVAGITGASIQALRKWEREGVIPKTLFPGEYRYYTEHQVELLSAFYQEVKKARYSPLARGSVINAQKQILESQWKVGI